MSENPGSSESFNKGGASRPYSKDPSKGPPRSGGRFSGPGGFRKKPMARRRMCRMCVDRKGFVDWKAINTLRNFVTDRGKVMSSRQTGSCAACQRKLTTAIKRARDMALLPYASV